MKKNNYAFVIIILIAINYGVYAQVAINTDGSNPNTSAMLDVKSNNKGMLIPRMSTSEMNGIATPATGLMVFNTDEQNFYYYNASSWNKVAGSDDGDWTVSGDNMYSNVSGNVGIGTSTPTNSKLQIEGTDTYDGMLRLNNIGTNGASFFMGSTNDSWTAGNNKFIMGHGSPSSSNVDLTIETSGNVGIGTSSPTEKLEVNGSVKIGDYTLPSSDGTSEQFLKTDGSGNANWSDTYWTENSGDIYRSTGNVGIGTDSPSGMFQVYKPTEYINEALDQQQTSTSFIFFEHSLLWQSFTAGANGYLSKIELWDGGQSIGTFTMKIYSGEGIGGALLGTADLVSRNQNPYGYVSFTFPTPVSVLSSQQYTFAVEVSGTQWSSDERDTNPYSGGVAFYDGDIQSNEDLRFKTYVANSYINDVDFIVNDTGYVGIGTTSPSNKLEVNGNADFTGNVGIGITTPAFPLEVNGYAEEDYTNYGYLTTSGAGTYSGTYTNYVSIKASHRVAALKFTAYSDQRIKTGIQSSNIMSDLEKINQIRVANYHFIDSIGNSNKLQKGVIAQEAEKVLPEAVNTHSDFIPDIFVGASKIKHSGNLTIIETPKKTGLKKGDLVRLITPLGMIETGVVEIITENSFAITIDKKPEQVFVYGKKVDDFRTVDYNYIFMTGIGAIQELSDKVNELERNVEQIDKLTAEVEALKSLIIQGNNLALKSDIK